MSVQGTSSLGKKQSVISVKDGDRLIFQTAKFDSLSTNIDDVAFSRSSGESALYQCSVLTLEDDSVPLLYSRMDYEGVGEGRGRIVGYINSFEDPSESEMIPFRGVFDVSVDFDNNQNSLTLSFFCNVLSSFSGDYLSDADVVESFENESISNIKKVFCVSSGFLLHGYISGGVIGESSVSGYGYFPVFMKPRVVSESSPESVGLSPVIARIDGIASGGGYNAVEQEYNGSSFTDKTDGRTWGNDYNSETGSYDPRSLEAVRELNGNSVSTSYGIAAVDQGTKTFSVTGDYENVISGTITIVGSTGNDGTYTVSSATYDDVDEQTDIVVTESIPDSTADGNIYQYDGMYVLVFPVPYSSGTQWFFESGLSEVAMKEAVFDALKNLPGYDPTVYQLIGHDDTPVMMWFSKGDCP